MLRLPPGYLNREDIRVPCTTMASVWKRAMEQLEDPDLAFHMRVEQMFRADRTTQLIMEASATVREAFEQAANYSVLIADVMAVRVGEDGDVVFVEFTPRPDWEEQHPEVVKDCLNITCVSAVEAVKGLIGKPVSPALLSFTFPTPENVAEYYRAYDCSIEFGAETNRVGFTTEVTEHSISSVDAGLLGALRVYADELKSTFKPHGPFSDRVRRYVLEAMDPFPPTLPAAAEALGMSPRSVQRRLGEEDLTYKRVTEDVRMELAERYLTTSDRSIDEIAYLSGYAETSSFVRAFKRRHGVPPGKFGNRPRRGTAAIS